MLFLAIQTIVESLNCASLCLNHLNVMLFATLSRQVWFDLTWTVQQTGSVSTLQVTEQLVAREVLDH